MQSKLFNGINFQVIQRQLRDSKNDDVAAIRFQTKSFNI